MRVLVTGGAGYIGSHVCLELLRNGHDIAIIDNLSNSSENSLKRIKYLSNRSFVFSKGDIRFSRDLDEVFSQFMPEVVVHCAGLKSVPDSLNNPIDYYDVNVSGSICLLRIMEFYNCFQIIFSSSATVYCPDQKVPFSEISKVNPLSTYGKTKLIFENMLDDWATLRPANKAISLRYFNPVGADVSGEIGEAPTNAPGNLMPIISEVALRKRAFLTVYGDDYETCDGTGERDYVHVSDLANCHVKAVEKVQDIANHVVLNVGTGKSTSVLELVRTFEKASRQKINYKIDTRRPGDVAKSFADPTYAESVLGYKCTLDLSRMCMDTWKWLEQNPNGYD